MRSYGQYCPMAKAAEILADRWTLLIVRDLLCGVAHFNDLERGLPGISRALLAQRLRRLQRAGILERRVAGKGRATAYHLTAAGRELQALVDVLVHWGARWAFGEPEPAELDPVLLMWWMRGRIHHERLPPQRVVVQFDFRGPRGRTLWLVLTGGEASVCLQHPGFDVDLLVTADLAAFYHVWLGRRRLAEAVDDGSVQLDGMPAFVRAFPTWLAWSPTADVVRAAGQRAPG
ncbi:MAG TPA: helix-turn-helix domain-containing protein [Chloroflexota bacterium]|nr:helix-turn-helix domain-containing protein [Chloroflexota bacterium]